MNDDLSLAAASGTFSLFVARMKCSLTTTSDWSRRGLGPVLTLDTSEMVQIAEC